ncbi:hypothetical protein SAY86_008398 [Trapa natans]|uniref:Cation/H+ exchanger transmembrane domain-containing protein n=1 Tax=Trapa natans TaxID=22666 RepID=A0AAN7K8F0_TRANT|nr:hypothetical protein SAY86_008398 [Trapa natans]
MGVVSGPYQPEYIVCQRPHIISSKGYWFGDHPFDNTVPLLFSQIVLVFIISRFIHFLFKPLKQSLFIFQVVAGIIVGPSVLGQYPGYLELFFPPIGILILETFSRLGFLIHLFTVGVQIDTSILKNPGRPAAFVGTSCFLFPYIVCFLTIYTLKKTGNFDGTMKNSLYFIAMFSSFTSFAVITNHLRDLRILNSEMGRMASNAAFICELCANGVTLFINSFNIAISISEWDSLLSFLSVGSLLVLIFFILRPAIIWSINHSFGGESIGESQFVFLIVAVLGVGLLFDIFGQQSALGVLLLGLSLPNRSSFRESLVNKIEAISAALLIPAFTTMAGMRTNLTFIGGRSSIIIQTLIITGIISKFCGTLLSAVYCGIPFRDAITLSCIMCCKGIIEVSVFITYKDWMVHQISLQLFIVLF